MGNGKNINLPYFVADVGTIPQKRVSVCSRTKVIVVVSTYGIYICMEFIS